MTAPLMLTVALLLSQDKTIFVKQKLENPVLSKQKEKQDLIEKLKRDIFKVNRSLGETDKLIAKSRNAPYLPDLMFRQAELYVEKSRYTYYLQAETRPEGAKGAMVSPETKLLKQRAQQIYNRILRDFPEFKDGDKVTFYLAHEQRELGEFDNMLKTLGDLIRKYPSSPLRLDSEQIIGDYWFDKADLKQAEEHYKNILDAPNSPVHDLARYKMGWIRINESKHGDAVTFFEAAAASAPIPGVDPAKSLNVKREALLDLVYSYTEARPAKGALQYFEKLSDSRATYSLALDKLGNRYFIKQQYEYAIPALRKLMEIQPDPELATERAEKLYDSIKAGKGKVLPKPEDVSFLVDAAVQAKTDPSKDEATRKKTLAELEEMSRDLATTIHVAAQKRDDKALYIEAAHAYERYLGLFRPKQWATMMMQNRADALFAAKLYPEAARQFEELALYLDAGRKPAAGEEKKNANAPKAEDPDKLDVSKDKKPDATADKDKKPGDKPADKDAPKDSKLTAIASVSKDTAQRTVGEVKTHDEALYGALVSHYSSLQQGEVERLNAFEVSDARQAMKILGAQYINRYPKSEHALEVKFNIARAYYEDGEYQKASELFKEFAIAYPQHKDATKAGNLALSALNDLGDTETMKKVGAEFAASALPQTFKDEAARLVREAGTNSILIDVLKRSEETGDIIEALLKAADDNKGKEQGEKALYGAFAACRDKRDFAREKEIGARFINEYPKSEYLADVILTMCRQAAEGGRYAEAAGCYEQSGQKFNDSTGLDGFITSAKLKMALGDYPGAIKSLEGASENAGPRKPEVLALIAQTRMKMHESGKAKAIAEQVLKLDRTNAAAVAIVAEVQFKEAPDAKPDQLIALLTQVTNSPSAAGEDAAKALWYLGEILYRQFKQIPGDKIEDKIAALQQLQGIYNQAASMGSAEWTVASLWRIASGLQHIADVVESTPVPAGLKPAEVEQFRTAVKNQVGPLKEQANNAFESCLTKAEQLEVFSAAVVGCRKKVDEAQSPLKGPPAERAVNVEAYQKKAEQTQAAADFEALGMAYLGAYHVKDAQLAFSRAIELENARASAHNGLGYALLLEGEPMAARQEYGQALDADPTYEKARVNVGALKCRFGDLEGAKRELSVIKDSSLAGPDVDPDWKNCK